MTDPRRRGMATARRISLAALAVGVPLLAWMVVYEGEPGALPLGLVLAGTAGLLWRRWRIASTRRSNAPP